jgi:hypothetical protein
MAREVNFPLNYPFSSVQLIGIARNSSTLRLRLHDLGRIHLTSHELAHFISDYNHINPQILTIRQCGANRGQQKRQVEELSVPYQTPQGWYHKTRRTQTYQAQSDRNFLSKHKSNLHPKTREIKLSALSRH